MASNGASTASSITSSRETGHVRQENDIKNLENTGFTIPSSTLEKDDVKVISPEISEHDGRDSSNLSPTLW